MAVFNISLLLLYLKASTVLSYSTGPPASACDTQLPDHGVSSQTSGSPVSLSVSPTTYQSRSTHTVTISGGTFKGFFVQARPQGSSQAVGQFDSSSSSTRLLSCSSGSNNGWTHNNGNDKTSTSLTWTAPDTDEGQITFRTPIVVVQTTYWAPEVTTSAQLTFTGPSWGNWQTWSSCDATCDGGTRTRTRTCNDPDTNDGVNCDGDEEESEDCNTQACPQPTWNPWGSFSACTQTCGGGTQTRTRTCNDPDTTDNIGCNGEDTETVTCNTQSCTSEDPTWNSWGSFSTCTQTCGSGSQTRTRTCNDPDTTDSTDCGDENTETVTCNTQSCTSGGSQDPTWTSWGSFSTCTQTCGGGSQTRTRTCNDPDTTDSNDCNDDTTETVTCNTQSCTSGGIEEPIWGSWSSYTTCSVTCDTGTQFRTRSCIDPDTTDTESCAGAGTDTRSCNTQSCPEATWSSWSPYTGCTRTCGTGTRTRTRTCNDPDDNQSCVGSTTDTATCNTQACPITTGGTWTSWDSWTGCSVTCDAGIRSRTRSCTPSASSCSQGSALETESCFEIPCVGGSLPWNEWSRWTPCSVTCEDGQRQRTRTCNDPDPFRGGRCNGDSVETERCNERCCDCGTVELGSFIWIIVGVIVVFGFILLVIGLICVYTQAGGGSNALLLTQAGAGSNALLFTQPPTRPTVTGPIIPQRRPRAYYY